MASLLELASEPQAVLIVEEPFGPTARWWKLCTRKNPMPPFSPGSRAATVTVEPLPDQDWIKLSPGRPAAGAGRALFRLWRA